MRRANRRTAARNHALLVYAIRQHAGWPIPQALQGWLQAQGSIPDAVPGVEQQRKACLRIWQQHGAALSRERAAGRVAKLLSGGQSGFIKPDGGGENLYFAVVKGKDAGAWQVGQRVSYLVTMGYDKKKARETQMATKLKAIPD